MKLQGQLEGQFWAAAAAGQPNLCVFYHTHTRRKATILTQHRKVCYPLVLPAIEPKDLTV